MSMVKIAGVDLRYMYHNSNLYFSARCFETDVDFAGGDMTGNPRMASSAINCQGLCQATSGCVAFVYAYSTQNANIIEGRCWLKTTKTGASAVTGLISGNVRC